MIAGLLLTLFAGAICASFYRHAKNKESEADRLEIILQIKQQESSDLRVKYNHLLKDHNRRVNYCMLSGNYTQTYQEIIKQTTKELNETRQQLANAEAVILSECAYGNMLANQNIELADRLRAIGEIARPKSKLIDVKG